MLANPNKTLLAPKANNGVITSRHFPAFRQRCSPIHAVKDIFMPALSSTMTEGKVVSWLKKVGDPVKKGDAVVVVESDKADMDVESFEDGILGGIVIQAGERALVGAPLAYIAETQEDIPLAAEKAKSGSSKQEPAANPSTSTKEEAAPEQPEFVSSIDAPEPALVINTSPLPGDGSNSAADSGDVAEEVSDSTGRAAPSVAPAPIAAPPPTEGSGRFLATPYAKQVAKELQVPLHLVSGTGPDGRVTATDVENFKASSSEGAAAGAGSRKAPAAEGQQRTGEGHSSVDSGEDHVFKPFTTLQKAVARNMLECIKVPVFTVSMDIETDRLDALVQGRLRPAHPEVTMSVALAKATALALKAHPIMFSACAPDLSGILYQRDVHVAMAVAMPGGGLITPVLRNVDSLDLFQLGRNWAELVRRARAKQLRPDEYSTGNFAISNLGMFGVDAFSAILPKNMSAILAVGSSKPKLVSGHEDGADGIAGGPFFAVRKVMRVTLTADHRVVYGADAAEFLRSLKKVIEKPDQLTL